MSGWLVPVTQQAVLRIDAVALLVIVGGTLQAVLGKLAVMFRRATPHERREVWLRYARWLIAGLTFLNYFLERDFNELYERKEREA
jgi:uncharacterized membrane protein